MFSFLWPTSQMTGAQLEGGGCEGEVYPALFGKLEKGVLILRKIALIVVIYW